MSHRLEASMANASRRDTTMERAKNNARRKRRYRTHHRQSGIPLGLPALPCDILHCAISRVSHSRLLSLSLLALTRDIPEKDALHLQSAGVARRNSNYPRPISAAFLREAMVRGMATSIRAAATAAKLANTHTHTYGYIEPGLIQSIPEHSAAASATTTSTRLDRELLHRCI